MKKNPRAYSVGFDRIHLARKLLGVWFTLLCLSPVLANDTPMDSQYVVYLADAGVIVLRLDLSIEGKNPREFFESYVVNLMKSMDVNADGIVTLEEARGKYLTDREARLAELVPRGESLAPDVTLDVRPADGIITRQEFVDYFRRIGFQPFLVQYYANVPNQAAANGQPRQVTNAGEIPLFSRLDVNRDRKLSARELSEAIQTLRRLDLDDDETISAAELTLNVDQSLVRPLTPQNNSRIPLTSPFLVLGSEESISKQIRRLIEKYDTVDPIKSGGEGARVRNQRLSAKELGISDLSLGRFDGDGDGQLDFDELRQFLTAPEPTVSLKVAIESTSPLMAEPASDEFKDKLRSTPDGAANMNLGTAQLSVVRGKSFGLSNVEMFLRPQFMAVDADGNGYLDMSESVRGFLFGAKLDDVDTDKNGQVYLDEAVKYFQMRSDAARSRTVLTINEQGRTLFEILDADRDQRLSFRELQSTADKISLWDANGNGLLEESEIPLQYHLTVSRGNLPAFGGNFINRGMNPSGELSERTAGPLWFRKMDKNRDGEVSEREFLGESAIFERLDRNQDGFIDLAEAVQVIAE